jgi:manganese transport protein
MQAGSTGVSQLLVLSQVILSLQLPFAVVPLVYFTGDRKLMGAHTNSMILAVVAWLITLMLISLNILLLVKTFT